MEDITTARENLATRRQSLERQHNVAMGAGCILIPLLVVSVFVMPTTVLIIVAMIFLIFANASADIQRDFERLDAEETKMSFMSRRCTTLAGAEGVTVDYDPAGKVQVTFPSGENVWHAIKDLDFVDGR